MTTRIDGPDRHRSPLWWWGTSEAVLAGIDAHNAVVRELAAGRETLFVDQAALIPSERRVYNDVCHLTVAGSELFVENMMEPLREVVGTGPPGSAVDQRFQPEAGAAVP